ncbi:hypothetical protein DSLASN_30520 [Desulfoluna limicola]|uniref:DUF1819 family protein n=1 Tax=Desulfoluna limicola TaxID=2810562 RepID=A0ABN6F700_9BACT|nr:DUF1819 family protein [Desulfoluna limicola]BCS97420.1 hypothetical protein DSLASN_30520 [Desulfoluna limicola]
MPEKPYSMSFTTAALLKMESRQIASLYLSMGNWGQVRDKAVEQNTIQARSAVSLKRLTRECISRLRLLPDDLISLICHGNSIEENAALWFGVCLRYPFIGEFAVEVLHEKFVRRDSVLGHGDYDRFFSRKAEWMESLEQLSHATRSKQRQVLFRMLKDADLLSDSGDIQPIVLTENLVQVLRNNPGLPRLIFPADVSHL